jgi:DNA-binding MarR family transcriptional regulator
MQSNELFLATFKDWIEVFMRRSMRNFVHYSKISGLSLSQIAALARIHKSASGVSDLGEELGVTSAAASQMLDRLVQQNLILRSEDPVDRRAKQIVLTEKGQQALKEGFNARQAWLEDLAATLSDREKEQVIAALNILITKAKQLENIPETEL